MIRSPISVYFSLSPNAVSPPRPLQKKLVRRRTSTQVRNAQTPTTFCQPCKTIKRKCTVAWKKVTQAARPSERWSYIPPGFTLVARPYSWARSTRKKTEEPGAERAARTERGTKVDRSRNTTTRHQRLKNPFSLRH